MEEIVVPAFVHGMNAQLKLGIAPPGNHERIISAVLGKVGEGKPDKDLETIPTCRAGEVKYAR